MNPAKAALLAELMAERFPSADALEAESRLPVPTKPNAEMARYVAFEEAAREAVIRHAMSDTPSAIEARRAALDEIPTDFRDVSLWVPEVLRRSA